MVRMIDISMTAEHTCDDPFAGYGDLYRFDREDIKVFDDGTSLWYYVICPNCGRQIGVNTGAFDESCKDLIERMEKRRNDVMFGKV